MAPIIGVGIGITRQLRPAATTNAAPVNTSVPVITGTAIVGQELTASLGSWTGFPAPTFAYQWRRDGVDIGSATSSAYTLVAADTDTVITVRVTATNSEGSANATSAGTESVRAIPDNTVLPVITGTATDGETLTSSTGTWTGSPTPTYTYQWRRNGVDISGETTNTYDLVTADVGTNITVVVTGTNTAGSDIATSVAVGPIEAAAVTRTLDSVTVDAFSSGSFPVALVGDAADGETVEWVLYSGSDPTTSAQVDVASWAGGTIIDSGTFAWSAAAVPITLDDGIAKANYKLVCIVNNGALSNFVISAAFEVDTTDSLLTAESFTDGGAEDVDWAFTSNEAVSYRVSLWADGSTPSAADIESGTGSVATVTGTAAAAVAETGTFAAVGDGIYVPTIWVSDDYLNEYTETYADVTVAAVGGDPLAADSGRLYRYEIATTTRSGSDVTVAPDGTPSPVDLTSTPGAFDAPTQASVSAPIVFNSAASPGPTVIQSSTLDAANRKVRQHLAGGGSNAIRVFLVIDAATLTTSPSVFFSETNQANENNAIAFGAYTSSSNVRFFGRIRNVSGSDYADILTTTTNNAASTGKCIIEYHITQTTWEVFLDGVSKGTGSSTAANLPNYATARVNLGATATNTASTRAATGDFYEVFITSTADSTFASTARSYLTTKYGL